MSYIENIVKLKIEKEQGISVADFMSICLGHPEYGYYIKNNPLGRSGDFITAPEMSQIFGEIWGIFLTYHLDKIAPKNEYYLCEVGAGRGTLLSDILRIIPQKPSAIFILESNHYLIEQQKKTLSNYQISLHHIEHLRAIKTDKPIIFIANEFFDALPIHIYQQIESTKEEVKIHYSNQKGFFFSQMKGRIIEDSPLSQKYMQEISRLIQKTSGLGIFCDYGYETPLNRMSFRGYYKHELTNGLSYLGDCDLTADVDFKKLNEIAVQEHCSAYQILTQKDFLESLHIHIYAQKLLEKMQNEDQKHLLQTALNKLLSPEEMGNKFKFLCVTGYKEKEVYPFQNI